MNGKKTIRRCDERRNDCSDAYQLMAVQKKASKCARARIENKFPIAIVSSLVCPWLFSFVENIHRLVRVAGLLSSDVRNDVFRDTAHNLWLPIHFGSADLRASICSYPITLYTACIASACKCISANNHFHWWTCVCVLQALRPHRVYSTRRWLKSR